MFGPITSTSFKGDEANPSRPTLGLRWGFMGITLSSCQGYFKVTVGSNQPKRVKIVCFCSNSVHLRCL